MYKRMLRSALAVVFSAVAVFGAVSAVEVDAGSARADDTGWTTGPIGKSDTGWTALPASDTGWTALPAAAPVGKSDTGWTALEDSDTGWTTGPAGKSDDTGWTTVPATALVMAA